MKRGIVSLIIFILCILLCIYFSDCTNKTFKFAYESISVTKELIENKEYEKALIQSEKTKNEWNKRRLIIDITSDRSSFKEVEYAIDFLPFLLKDGNTERASEECDNALCEIEYLLDREKLTAQNLF